MGCSQSSDRTTPKKSRDSPKPVERFKISESEKKAVSTDKKEYNAQRGEREEREKERENKKNMQFLDNPANGSKKLKWLTNIQRISKLKAGLSETIIEGKINSGLGLG
jgi:hypothetical protein